MAKNYINIGLWRDYHYGNVAFVTDGYYASVARKLFDISIFSEYGRELGENICEELALALSFYLEDVVSDFGWWEVFTSKHKGLYGKYLPFYAIDEEDYYQDEVNFQDICFMVWMIAQKYRNDTFLNPENPYLMKLASQLYKVLYDEFEKAPINEELCKMFQIPELFDDFYIVKHVLGMMTEKAYLLYPFENELRFQLEEELRPIFDKANEHQLDYAIQATLSLTKKIGPLNLYAKDWYALLLKKWGMEKESEQIAAIEGISPTVFKVKNYDMFTIQLEDADGREYPLLRSSLADSFDDSILRENKSLVASLAKYKNEWLLNGMSSWGDKKLFELYKEHHDSISGDTFVHNMIMIHNEGHPFLYFKSSQDMNEWFATNIGVAKEFDFPEKFRDDSFFAVFVTESGKMAIIPNAALCIKDRKNPYYNQEYAAKEAFGYLVSSEAFPDEAVRYMIEHAMFPDASINSTYGKERGRELVQDNIDFIVRFMRTGTY